MNNITIAFETMEQLWEFKQLTNTLNCRIHSIECTITSEFNEAQVKFAASMFKARALENDSLPTRAYAS
jgi:hypothetical protein